MLRQSVVDSQDVNALDEGEFMGSVCLWKSLKCNAGIATICF